MAMMFPYHDSAESLYMSENILNGLRYARVYEKQIGGFSMSECMTQTQQIKKLILICVYCEKQKNINGNWNHASEPMEHVSAKRKSHGICPKCLQEHFPAEYASLCLEGKIIDHETNAI
jgi:hypothetical protein